MKSPISGQTEDPLVIEDLSVRFGAAGSRNIVEGVSLRVKRGEILGLVGESGSGKSVSCLAAMGLLGPSFSASGHIRLVGQDILGKDASPSAIQNLRGAKAAMIFQDAGASLNSIATIGRQLGETVARLCHLDRRAAKARAIELLHRVGIDNPEARYDSYPFQLSGGQNQRVMIALAMAANPQLLFADEPTTALDVTVQAKILELISLIRDETGMAVVFVSHDLGVVAELCDRVAVMYKGRIVETGPVKDVLERPAHPYTLRLIRAVPRMEGGASAPAPAEAEATAPAPLLSLRDVSCDYAVRAQSIFGKAGVFRAVNEVSFDLSEGDSLAIIGESGSGKSTMAKLMLGIEGPSTGQVLFEGQPIPRLGTAEHRAFSRQVQLVPQSPYSALDPRKTIGYQIEEPLVIHAIGTPETRRQRLNELLVAVGLSPELAGRYPHELSGGQCQRVVIARALALGPKLLICDEPTSALDVSVQAQIIALLGRLRVEFGVAIIFISHDLRLVRSFCRRGIVMKRGRVMEEAATADLFANPQNDYTRQLMDAVPDLPVVAADLQPALEEETR